MCVSIVVLTECVSDFPSCKALPDLYAYSLPVMMLFFCGLRLVFCSWFAYVTEEASNVLIFSYLQLNVLRAKLDSLLNACIIA
jgi:hypothetical protein